MQKTVELLEAGIYDVIVPEKSMTIADLLKEMNLEGRYFGILVDGKKATPETKVNEYSSVVILPNIAGG